MERTIAGLINDGPDGIRIMFIAQSMMEWRLATTELCRVYKKGPDTKVFWFDDSVNRENTLYCKITSRVYTLLA